MVENVKRTSDLIQTTDAVGWLDALARVSGLANLNEEGRNMMRDMAASASEALRDAADERGLIQRSEAMAQIYEALPNPPAGIHPRNADAWYTIRCTFREAMWYPVPAERRVNRGNL